LILSPGCTARFSKHFSNAIIALRRGGEISRSTSPFSCTFVGLLTVVLVHFSRHRLTP